MAKVSKLIYKKVSQTSRTLGAVCVIERYTCRKLTETVTNNSGKLVCYRWQNLFQREKSHVDLTGKVLYKKIKITKVHGHKSWASLIESNINRF